MVAEDLVQPDQLLPALSLSGRELEAPGASYAYISRIEAGDRNPSEKALRHLAAKLGTTALYLETGDAEAPCPHCGRTA